MRGRVSGWGGCFTFLGDILRFLLNELSSEVERLVDLYNQDPVKNTEQVRLIEGPFSILQFVVHLFSLKPLKLVEEFIRERLIFSLIKVVPRPLALSRKPTTDECARPSG